MHVVTSCFIFFVQEPQCLHADREFLFSPNNHNHNKMMGSWNNVPLEHMNCFIQRILWQKNKQSFVNKMYDDDKIDWMENMEVDNWTVTMEYSTLYRMYAIRKLWLINQPIILSMNEQSNIHYQIKTQQVFFLFFHKRFE